MSDFPATMPHFQISWKYLRQARTRATCSISTSLILHILTLLYIVSPPVDMAGTTLTTKFTNLFRHSTKHTKKAVPRILTVLQNDRADITNTRLEAVEGFPICVLLTEPILAKETDDYTVKNVKFVVESNDQGWCNEDNFEGVLLRFFLASMCLTLSR